MELDITGAKVLFTIPTDIPILGIFSLVRLFWLVGLL